MSKTHFSRRTVITGAIAAGTLIATGEQRGLTEERPQ